MEFNDHPIWGWNNQVRLGGRATITVNEPGIHTKNVWMREDGTVIDKLVLTTNSTLIPTGLGPTESPHN